MNADIERHTSEKRKKLEQRISCEIFKDMKIREEIQRRKREMTGVKPDRKEANTLYCNC